MGSMSEVEEFRHVVRVAGVDLPGDMALAYAISWIKGIGINLAHIICRKIELPPDAKLGALPEEKIEKLDKVLRNVHELNLPSWLLNRRRDPFTGENRHLITSDLVFTVRQDIEFMKKINSWKGFRHKLGLKVRGQRSRVTGRTGLTIGVSRRKGGRR